MPHNRNSFRGPSLPQGVANSVMLLVDTVRRRTEQQLEDSGKVLQVGVVQVEHVC